MCIILVKGRNHGKDSVVITMHLESRKITESGKKQARPARRPTNMG